MVLPPTSSGTFDSGILTFENSFEYTPDTRKNSILLRAPYLDAGHNHNPRSISRRNYDGKNGN